MVSAGGARHDFVLSGGVGRVQVWSLMPPLPSSQCSASRISGYENTLLGYRSKLYPIFRPIIKQDKSAMDALSFGHVIFEMTLVGVEHCNPYYMGLWVATPWALLRHG